MLNECRENVKWSGINGTSHVVSRGHSGHVGHHKFKNW